MFELRLIVKDRALGETLRVLKPFALEPPVVIPVDIDAESSTNVAEPKKNTVQSARRKKPTKTSVQVVRDKIREFCKDTPVGETRIVAASAMKEWLDEAGHNETSYSYVQTTLVRTGELIATTNRGEYKVNLAKVTPAQE